MHCGALNNDNYCGPTFPIWLQCHIARKKTQYDRGSYLGLYTGQEVLRHLTLTPLRPSSGRFIHLIFGALTPKKELTDQEGGSLKPMLRGGPRHSGRMTMYQQVRLRGSWKP